MKISIKTRWIVALIVITTMGIAWLTRTPEPMYQGKTVSEWFSEVKLKSMNGGLSVDPDCPRTKAILAIGKDSEPYLMSQIRCSNSPIGIRIYEWRNRLSGKRVGTDLRGYKASFCLIKIGSQSADLVPDLIAMIRDPHCRDRAFIVPLVGSIHAQPEIAVPALEELLRTTKSLRLPSAIALGEFGEAAQSALPALILAWRSSTDKVERIILANAVMKISPDAAEKEDVHPIYPIWTPDRPEIKMNGEDY